MNRLRLKRPKVFPHDQQVGPRETRPRGRGTTGPCGETPFFSQAVGYIKRTGPGLLQSAMTLGPAVPPPRWWPALVRNQLLWSSRGHVPGRLHGCRLGQCHFDHRRTSLSCVWPGTAHFDRLPLGHGHHRRSLIWNFPSMAWPPEPPGTERRVRGTKGVVDSTIHRALGDWRADSRGEYSNDLEYGSGGRGNQNLRMVSPRDDWLGDFSPSESSSSIVRSPGTVRLGGRWRGFHRLWHPETKGADGRSRRNWCGRRDQHDFLYPYPCWQKAGGLTTRSSPGGTSACRCSCRSSWSLRW